jgi:hypothetical protein
VTLQGRPDRRAHSIRPPTWFGWWVALSPQLAWRVPLLAVFALIGGWYLFRGLVRMAFIFDASAVISFLLAPLLLPLAALPAACFYLAARLIPRIWRDARIGGGTKALNTVVLIPAAVLLAAFTDVVETSALLSLGVRLPTLLLQQLPPGL